MVSGEEQIDMVQIFLSHPQKHDLKKSRHLECRQEAGDTSYIDMV